MLSASLLRHHIAQVLPRSSRPSIFSPLSSRRIALALLTIAATAFGLGCASLGRQQESLKPVTVEIKNNLTMPTLVTVYVQSQDGFRQILGDVPPTETRAFAFTPRSLSERYRLVAQAPLYRPYRSQPFTIGSEMTGWIQWTLIPNIIGFWDREEENAPQNDSTLKQTDAEQHGTN